MIKLQENQIKDIEKVEFQKETYYLVEAVAEFLKEDLSDVESISLIDKKFATLEKINEGRKREPLSHFNQMLLNGKHYKK